MIKNIAQKTLKYTWLALFIPIIFCLIKTRVPDSDTFFLIASGRYIVETGTVPTINPFVIHENFGVIIQQWLFDVIIYYAYELLGNAGILLFVLTTYTAGMTLLYKYFGLFTNNRNHKITLLIICGIIYTAFGVARPTCITFIIFLSLLYCLELYRRTNKLYYLAPLPFLSLIQINMHSAIWPMMFVLMLPYVFPYTMPNKSNIKSNVKKWFAKNRFILPTLAIMLSVGLINPNGIDGINYVLNSYGSATGGAVIQELTPPQTNELYGIIIIILAIFLTVYVFKNKEKLSESAYDMQYEFTRFYLAAGVLILACMHTRNIWYLIVGAAPIVLIVLKDCNFKVRSKPKRKKKEKAVITLLLQNMLSICFVVILSYFLLTAVAYSSKTTEDSKFAPYKAAEYLDNEEYDNIKLYTEFNNGAFMEFKGYKVYMDARPELFQKKINGQEDIYTEYCNVIAGNIDYKNFLAKYDFTHLIVSNNTMFDMYLSLNENYEAVVVGNGYTLYKCS